MTVLSYFDPMNFANDVRCPTLVGLGLLDDVVPAPTVHDAIAGYLGGPHEVVELPVSHTQLPEEKLWYDFEAYWFRLAVGASPQISEGEETFRSRRPRCLFCWGVRQHRRCGSRARPRGPSSCARRVGQVEIRHDQPCATPETSSSAFR
jgi:hypothetical protein